MKEKAKKPSVQIESGNPHARNKKNPTPKRSKQTAEVNGYRQIPKLAQVDMDALRSVDVCHAGVISTNIHSTPHRGAAKTKDT